ncbi:MAG: hydroxymethylglutaryl-CoA lyase [Fimbriimonas sp.]
MRIVEVGPRDGLQNEATPIPTDVKLRLIARLAEAGLKEIEATSFVSPKWVPQLGDAAEMWPQLPPGPLYSALVPNAKGLERALSVGVKRIAVFTAASDAFTQKNINMTVEQSLDGFRTMLGDVEGLEWIRGYVSTAFECPYAGRIDAGRVVEVANVLVSMGCSEISFGDTIGTASPSEVTKLVRALRENFQASLDRVDFHFHDTNGTAIANVMRAIDLEGPNVFAFDSSAGGLGGCPYAPGAGGNLATEDLVYLLEREGIATGIDLDRLARATEEILTLLGRAPTAKAQVSARAVAARGCAT